MSLKLKNRVFILLCLGFILALYDPAYSQTKYDTQTEWTEPSLFHTCGGVNFYFSVSKLPGVDGKQRVQFKVENTNNFRVKVEFKATFVSDEGGTYTSPARETTLLSPRGSAEPPNLKWTPFGQEDLNRTTYPRVSKVGIQGVEVYNPDKMEGSTGYSRGEKVGACAGAVKEVARDCGKTDPESFTSQDDTKRNIRLGLMGAIQRGELEEAKKYMAEGIIARSEPALLDRAITSKKPVEMVSYILSLGCIDVSQPIEFRYGMTDTRFNSVMAYVNYLLTNDPRRGPGGELHEQVLQVRQLLIEAGAK